VALSAFRMEKGSRQERPGGRCESTQSASPRSDRADRLVENREQEVRVRLRDAHGRGKPDGLTPEPALAEEQAQLAGVFHRLGALLAARLLGGAVLDELDAEHEPLAPHVADDLVARLQLFE